DVGQCEEVLRQRGPAVVLRHRAARGLAVPAGVVADDPEPRGLELVPAAQTDAALDSATAGETVRDDHDRAVAVLVIAQAGAIDVEMSGVHAVSVRERGAQALSQTTSAAPSGRSAGSPAS